MGLRESARSSIAALIGAEPADLALVESGTHGIAIAVQALPLEPGDRVLMSDLEFLQMGASWRQMGARGVQLDVLANRDGCIEVDDVISRITPRTRVLAVSTVQWTNGFRVDLAALSQLCRDRGIILLADAAQHLGVLPFDVEDTPVDVLIASGHKWMGSPFGTGLLYLAPRIRGRLRLPVAGFFAARPPGPTWGEVFAGPQTTPVLDLDLGRDARTWEVGGTGNVPGAVALAEAARLFTEAGPDAAVGHVRELTGRLREGLLSLGLRVVSPDVRRSGITTFTTGSTDGDRAVVQRLAEAGITVSQRYCSGVGGVRVSVHWASTAEAIDALVSEVRDHRLEAA